MTERVFMLKFVVKYDIFWKNIKICGKIWHLFKKCNKIVKIFCCFLLENDMVGDMVSVKNTRSDTWSTPGPKQLSGGETRACKAIYAGWA